MMALPRLLLPAVAVVLLAACGTSPVGEFGGEKAEMTALTGGTAPASASQAPKDAVQKDAAPPGQNTAIQKAALSLSSVSDPSSKAYKIGPRDVLEVSVFKVPELSKVVQVSEAGTINYPLAGEVQAGGRTAREIEQDLTKLLGKKYLQNPEISVFVREYNSQRITVEGAVKKPGVYPIVGGMSLLQATATAGGFEDTAEQTVILIRQSGGKRSIGKFDVGQIRDGMAEDPQLEAGDVIITPTSDIKLGFNTVLRVLPLATLAPLM